MYIQMRDRKFTCIWQQTQFWHPNAEEVKDGKVCFRTIVCFWVYNFQLKMMALVVSKHKRGKAPASDGLMADHVIGFSLSENQGLS